MPNGNSATPSSSPREKALQLLHYLRDFIKLRSTVVRDIDTYARDGDVLWFGDLPQDRDCSSPAWNSGEEDSAPWLRVRQQRLMPPPALPIKVVPWVDGSEITQTAPDHEPVLREFIYVMGEQDEAPAEQHLADHSEVSELWVDYLPTWQAWRGERRRAESVQRVYARLFSIYQRQAKLGELYELVITFGLLQWRRPTGDIRRHCFVAAAELEFDRERGEIRLISPKAGTKLTHEYEMIEAVDTPPPEHFDVLREILPHWEEIIWSREMAEAALKEWSRGLHADARHSMELTPEARPGTAPLVDFAPALVLRKRGVQSTVKIYDEMIRQLEPEDAVPSFGLERLVESVADIEEGEDPIPPEALETPFPPLSSRIYFPKPANREQREIIARLRRHRGILVQGPPGTGKSHTIANLICHLLAEGKRVLVTSETPRALRVLKDKIPPALQALCIANLGSDTDSFRELEKSEQEITRRHATWNPRDYQSAVTDAEARLDDAQRQLAVIDRRLRDLRQREAEECDSASGGHRGTPSALAQRIETERARYAWCELSGESPDTPPISSQNFVQLVASYRDISQETAAGLALDFPTLDVLPSKDAFAEAVANIRRYEASTKSMQQHARHRAYAVLRAQPALWRQRLRLALLDVRQKKAELERCPHRWRNRALGELIEGHDAHWARIRNETRTLLSSTESLIVNADAAMMERPADFTDERLFQDVSQVLSALREGHTWPLFGLRFGPLGAYGHIKKSCRLNGIPADTPPVLERMAGVLDTRLKLGRAWLLWAELEVPPASGSAAAGHASLVHACRTLELAFALKEAIGSASSLLASVHSPLPTWQTEAEDGWLDTLNAADQAALLGDAEQALERSATILGRMTGPRAHPVSGRLRDALHARSADAWTVALEELASLLHLRTRLHERERMTKRLQSAAPALARSLAASFSDTAWDQRARDLTEAWAWSKTDAWLSAQDPEVQFKRLEMERRDRVADWESAMADLAAAKAWQDFLARLTPTQSEALKAWSLAVRSLGKNTGKSIGAARLREDVRRHASTASAALPAWIMPRHKVTEMIAAEPDRFDVVIVDEASQSGIDSLFLFHLGKKLIIVGDDQQISPAAGFVSGEQIAALQNLHLRDVPNRVALNVGSSLYDNARIRFGAAVVLREHFRCMPEIIQFSNDLCYAPRGTPLDPLRTFSTSRLEPVCTTFVEEGWREGGASDVINLAEAEALVAQVKACVADPHYAGKTMGVISLQGSGQALKIHQLLVAAIGAVEMDERDLICGDAYDFQGDERDVIFLSMVAAPNERIGVLSKSSDHQRFNVAASRARDQLWLFHSATLDDLSPACVRYRLLDYMREPRRLVDGEETEKRFDSNFERHVHDRITERGFRVHTQIAIGDPISHRYRIDLVVEGMSGRLAVECDGDRWHGPDRHEADMRRQRDLERAGWRFWRVRGGEFYRNPTAAMSSLWPLLEAQGVSASAGPTTTRSAKGENAAASPASEKSGAKIAPPLRPRSPEKSEMSQSASSSKASPLPQDPAPSKTTPNVPRKVKRSSGKTGADKKPASHLDLEKAKDEEVLDAFEAIIQSEGPVLCSRVYALCLQMAGVTTLSAKLKSRFNTCMYRGVREGRFLQTQDDAVGQLDRTVRMPGTSAVTVRLDGKRRWHEVPRTELRAFAEQRLSEGPDSPEDEIVRLVFAAYGGKRLDKQAAQELGELLRPIFRQRLLKF